MNNIIYVGNEEFCPGCRTLKPVLKNLVEELQIPTKWLDTDEDCATVATLNVTCLPTTIVCRGDVELGRIEGAFSQGALKARVTALLGTK